MPKLVCVECQRQYKIVKTGNSVIDTFDSPPVPYRIQKGDRWECPGCGHQIIAGFVHQPLAEHFQDELQGKLDKVLEDKDTIYCL